MGNFDCGMMEGGAGHGFYGCDKQCKECEIHYSTEQTKTIKMNRFKQGDDVVLIDVTGLSESEKLKGSVFKYDMDFVSGDKWGHISNDTVAMTAPWTSLQLKSEYDMQNNQNKTEVKRIPFDLERAIKGDKVIDREGSIYHDFFLTKSGILYAWFKRNESDVELYTTYNERGEWLCTRSMEAYPNHQHYHLFMAPVEKKGWIGIMKTNEDHITAIVTHAYPDEISLLNAINEYFTERILICTKEISWTE